MSTEFATACDDETRLRQILGGRSLFVQDVDTLIEDRFKLERSLGVDAFDAEPELVQNEFDIGLGEVDGSEGDVSDAELAEWELEALEGASDSELGFDPYAGQVLDDDPIDPYEYDEDGPQ